MSNDLKWVLVLVTLAGCVALSRTAPQECMIKVVQSRELDSLDAQKHLLGEKLEPKDVALIVSKVNNKQDKIAGVSYMELLNYNIFYDWDCQPIQIRGKFRLEKNRQFLSYPNLKSYYDFCLGEFIARCKQSPISIFGPYVKHGLKDHMEGLMKMQERWAKFGHTEPIWCLENYVSNQKYNDAKKLGEDCESFLNSINEAMKFYDLDRETILEALEKEALHLAVEHCGDLVRLIGRLKRPEPKPEPQFYPPGYFGNS
jgi:hypothetical protein